MSHTRFLASLLATLCLLVATVARADVGIQPIADQNIPSGKTLVVPIPATDPNGPARTYSVTISQPTSTTGSTTVSATNAGINYNIRTGDPHFVLGVSYTDSNSVQQTGTMEFQLLREFMPMTTNIISGLTEGGFYGPKTTGTQTKFITFHRIVPGFVIQGGDPLGNSQGGPGSSGFAEELNKNLIFSGSGGRNSPWPIAPPALAGSSIGQRASVFNVTHAFLQCARRRHQCGRRASRGHSHRAGSDAIGARHHADRRRRRPQGRFINSLSS